MGPSDIAETGHSALQSGMFDIDTIRGEDGLCFRLSGELDVGSVDKLEEAIRVAEKSDERMIVVDLSDLEFIDSTGLSALLKAKLRSRQNGQRVTVMPSKHDAVTRLFALTCTGEILD